MEVFLDIALIGLLGLTLVHAVRLERALGVLRRDRAALAALVAGFNDSTKQAEAGTERLRAAAEGAGRAIARQIEAGNRLREDLGFLSQRAEAMADRLETLLRQARPDTGGEEPRRIPPRVPSTPEASAPKIRSQAERDLMKALRLVR